MMKCWETPGSVASHKQNSITGRFDGRGERNQLTSYGRKGRGGSIGENAAPVGKLSNKGWVYQMKELVGEKEVGILWQKKAEEV